MATPNLTAARLRELLSYDPDTGLFRWKVQTSKRVKVGDIAGTLVKIGYISISIDADMIRAHRLAWLYVHGSWPTGDIDHIDGNRANNRWSNLRDVTRSMNAQNLKRAHADNAASGLLGVYRDKKKWAASLTVNGKRHRLGNFTTPEEAHAAYLKAKRELHTACTI